MSCLIMQTLTDLVRFMVQSQHFFVIKRNHSMVPLNSILVNEIKSIMSRRWCRLACQVPLPGNKSSPLCDSLRHPPRQSQNIGTET